MSQENVEIARRFYTVASEVYERIEALREAHESGDFSQFLPIADETLDADVLLRPPEDSPFPEGGTREWRGREGFLRFIAAQAEGFETMWVKTEDFIDAGEKVVVPVEFGGLARHTGIEVTFAVVQVLTIRDGKVAEFDIYTSKAQALEAAGLSEHRDT
jgi:ketosteroid isomerase-like protein